MGAVVASVGFSIGSTPFRSALEPLLTSSSPTLAHLQHLSGPLNWCSTVVYVGPSDLQSLNRDQASLKHPRHHTRLSTPQPLVTLPFFSKTSYSPFSFG
mmetsp:Transcript_22505/g.37168  ORF Transcript_22505/g.37168 Transcript_22505/m.37168 type:complete len:99 (-) Transcript_22505:359-655(-)